MGTNVIEVRDVSKRFVIRKEKSLKERVVNFGRSNLHKEDFWALRDITLDIEAGTTVGLVGPNGSGKSTLLKTIGGILQPTTGTVGLRGRLAALLELGAGFHQDLTGRENVYLNASILGLSRQQTDGYFDAIVDFSGIEEFIDTQVKFYSSGMYVRLAFAVAVHVDPDVLLVDEVLAVGDEPFQRKCMDRIRGFQRDGRTIVLVTHSLDQVAQLCDRAVVLDHGRIAADGAPGEALRVLRSEFEQTRLEERARSDEQAAAAAAAAAAAEAALPATGDDDGTSAPEVETVTVVGPVAEVTAVELLHDGEPVAELPVGASLTVRIKVTTRAEVPSPSTGFSIQSSSGQVIYGTNSRALGRTLPTASGEATYDFAIPSVMLGEGTYTVTAAIADGDGIEFHRLMDSVALTVVADLREVGLVRLGAELVLDGATAVSSKADG